MLKFFLGVYLLKIRTLLVCALLPFALLSVIISFPSTFAQSMPPSPKAALNVGYRVLDIQYENGGKHRVLPVAVWYPTKTKAALHQYGRYITGHAAYNATLAPGRYPLLLFAHGYSGSALNYRFLSETLAAHGWIVAAPDFSDRYSGVRIHGGVLEQIDGIGLLKHANEITKATPEDRELYQYRLDEMQLAFNRLLTEEPFSKSIDQTRIAVGGHSFGGFTALGLTGPIPQRWDPRIKAVLIYSSGAGGYLFTENELAKVRVPSMYFQGEKEKQEQRGNKTMAELSAKIFRNVPPPKYFLEIKGGTHGSFNNWYTRGLLQHMMAGTNEHFDIILEYSLAFLEGYGARDERSKTVLESGDPRLSQYIRIAE